MGKYEKLLQRIQDPQQWKSVRFQEIDTFLKQCGFECKKANGKGDHRVFKHKPSGTIVNIDPKDPPLPPYNRKEILKAYSKLVEKGFCEEE